MARLTDRSVKTAGAGRYGDGNGLHLIVSDSGRRKWVLRYQMNGARHDMGLGSYPAVTLAEARIAAADARNLIAQGVDPLGARIASRKAAKPIPTFQEMAQVVIRRGAAKIDECQGPVPMGTPPRIRLLRASARTSGA